LAIEKLALENLAKRRVRKAVEPSDWIELLHVDIAIGHAGWIDIHVNHFADNQRMPVRTKLKDTLELALEMDRNLFDARRCDFDARNRGETGFSESPAGKALAESTISRHTCSVTTLKQNSPVSRTFLSVCFSLPSGLRAIVSEIIGGMTQTTVKKENGARLGTPLLLNVDAQPIGRGTTAPVSSRYT
jgi:hypothetical protein